MNEDAARPLTRIQRRNRTVILEGALTVFAAHGFRGATLDQIAEVSGLSKPNVLYYFDSKDAIHRSLLTGLLDMWLAPLRLMTAEGDPLDQVQRYVRAKLQMSRDFPRESRLFAHEVMQGAPHLSEILKGSMRELVEARVRILQDWIDAGRLANVNPHHLIFSIWALTQHYADFDTQIRAVLGPDRDPFAEADQFLENLYTRMLTVQKE